MGIGGCAVGLCAPLTGIKKMINSPKNYKMRIVFRWTDNQAEHSHALRGIKKMVLDSGLPYEPSKFVTSQPRLAYGPAPAKGQRAEREYLDIYLLERRSEEEVRAALLQTAPSGFEILQLTRVPYPLPSVQNLMAAIRYRVKGDFSAYISSGRKLEDWNGMSQLAVTVQALNGITYEKNLTDGLLASRVLGPQEIELTLVPISGQWIRPQWFMAAWLDIPVPAQDENFTVEGFDFIRQELCWRDTQGVYHTI